MSRSATTAASSLEARPSVARRVASVFTSSAVPPLAEESQPRSIPVAGPQEVRTSDLSWAVRERNRGYFVAGSISRSRPPVLARQGKGAIVNIASISAHVGHANLALYGAAKASVKSMTEALSGELGPMGIRVNAVSPGSIVTPLSSGAGTQEYRDETVRITPLGRKGQPEDIAGAVAYFVSPAASFVTGQTILVDGGRWANGRIPQVPARPPR